VERRKKRKTLRRVGIFAGGHPWPPPTPKAELRPKAAFSRKGFRVVR